MISESEHYVYKSNQIDTNPETNMAIQSYFDNKHSPLVVILSGSDKDEWFIKKLRSKFVESSIYVKEHICSAHKKTRALLKILEDYNYYRKYNRQIIFITVKMHCFLLVVIEILISYMEIQETINC